MIRLQLRVADLISIDYPTVNGNLPFKII